MSMLNTDKLTVAFLEGAYERAPLIPRRYTVTHSVNMQDIFLTIGPDFVYEKFSAKRNDVLGEWLYVEDGFRFYVYLYIDVEYGRGVNASDEDVRLQDLLLTLETIRYGDKRFFDSRPELDQYPIIVYFLFENPTNNKAEYWGAFSDYSITLSQNHISANSMMEYHVLIDEKIGDVNGDGIMDRVSVYGDKLPKDAFVNSIIIKIEGDQSTFNVDMITELNGYNPTLFLGDFTKDQVDDILFRMDKMFNSMDSKDKGEYGISIETVKNNQLETIFVSDRYNAEYPFLVEYKDLYKVSIMNVKENKLFFLDISDKGSNYLSQYYDVNGELKKPAQGNVFKAEAFIPVISNEKEYSYDLLAVHRIVGGTGSDILGYVENLLSWDGERFVSIRMVVSTLGTNLISMDQT